MHLWGALGAIVLYQIGKRKFLATTIAGALSATCTVLRDGRLAKPKICSLCHSWDKVVMWSPTTTQRWLPLWCHAVQIVWTHTCDKVIVVELSVKILHSFESVMYALAPGMLRCFSCCPYCMLFWPQGR